MIDLPGGTTDAGATRHHRPQHHAGEDDHDQDHITQAGDQDNDGSGEAAGGRGDASGGPVKTLEELCKCTLYVDAWINCVRVPCGHKNCCRQCAERFLNGSGPNNSKCPLCRKQTRGVRNAFPPWFR